MKLLLKYFIWNFVFLSVSLAQDPADVSEISLDSLLSIRINTVSKYLQTSSEAPASVTIITSKDIQSFGYNTLDEVLRSVRGYYISNDRNYTYLGVRGFSRPSDYNNRILIQLNGHTLNENVFGSAFIETALGVNLEAVERIEIMRGPGSAIYGTGAMFSVINIITKTGEQQDGYDIALSAGSYGKLQTNISAGKKFSNGFDLFFSGLLGEVKGQDHYYKELDTPENNNGHAFGKDWDRYIGFQTRMEYKNFTLQALHTYRRKEIPTGSYNILLSEINETHDGNSVLELQYKDDIDYDKELTVKGYYQDYIYEGIYFIKEPGRDATSNKWAGGEAQLQWDLITNNRLILGTEYKKQFVADYHMWSANAVYFSGDFPHSSFSAYLSDQWTMFRNFDIHLGLRYDHYPEVGSYIVPRFAAIYNPFNSTTLKLLYGTAFRRPNVYEFYYADPGIQKPNPMLASENIRSTEFIVEQKLTNDFLGLISVYKNDIKDLIDPVHSDSLLQFQNISRVNSKGVELELNYFPKFNVRISASYVYQLSGNDISDAQISNSPRQTAKLGIVIPLFRIISAAFDLYYETSRGTLKGTGTEPFYLANLNLTSMNILDFLTISLKVNNILNTSYFTPGGFEHVQDAIRQDGRNYSLKLNFGF